MGPRDQSEVIRLSDNCLYPLRHLTGLTHFLIPISGPGLFFHSDICICPSHQGTINYLPGSYGTGIFLAFWSLC